MPRQDTRNWRPLTLRIDWRGPAIRGATALLATLVCGQVLVSADQPKLRQLSPLPTSVRAPDDNPTTPEKVALGKQLFFDSRLSGDNTMSCASCHLPEKGFTDGRPRAVGHGGKELPRNTPTLWNVGYYASYFWDGRATTLEAQALLPIEDADEMHQDLAELVQELTAIPGYVRQFQQVFDSAVTSEGVAKALAAFERSLVTEAAPFDRYLAGDKTALSEEAQRGLELFVGDSGCIRCHQGRLLSDGQYHRIGVSLRDEGRKAATGIRDDRARFRTPSLRNLRDTGPYMHDGSLETLFDVVLYYFRGVPTHAPDDLKLDVEPLWGQSVSDIAALVAFLESLNSETPLVLRPELP